MAARPETKVVLESARVRCLPPVEGVAHLIAELEAGLPEPEVLVVSAPCHLDRDGVIPPPAARQAYCRSAERVAELPLIDGIHELHESSRLVAETTLDPVRDPFLAEHRLHGHPILPVAVGMELFAEAASILDPEKTVVGIRDVQIANGFRFYSDAPQCATVHAAGTADGVQCELRADFFGRHGRLADPRRLYLTATVETSDRAAELASMPSDRPGSWHTMEYLDLEQATQRGRIYIGRALQCLREVAFDPGGCWGRIDAPPQLQLAGGRSGDRWLLPSVVLDGCFQAAGAFLFIAHQTIQLPQAIGRLRFGRLPRPGERCLVRHLLRERNLEHAKFDFVLYGDDDDVILTVEGFRFVIVSR
jgi:3-hydroxymyristoyl/3-hydroxydecanoyl-(acyl carrier protein) dehydratase